MHTRLAVDPLIAGFFGGFCSGRPITIGAYDLDSVVYDTNQGRRSLVFGGNQLACIADSAKPTVILLDNKFSNGVARMSQSSTRYQQ